MDMDSNHRMNSSVDLCQYKINNDFHCFNQVIEFYCGFCTAKFCLDHLSEHDHETQREEVLG